MIREVLNKTGRGVAVALALACLMAGGSAFGKAQALGAVKDVAVKDAYVEVSCKNGAVRISSKGPGTLRIRAVGSKFSEVPSFALQPDEAADQAPKMSEDGGNIVLDTGLLRAVVDRRSGNINVLDSAGNELIEEPADGGVFFEGDSVKCVKAMPADEHYYGFGEKTGRLDKRGTRMEMWNSDNLYTTRSE